MKRIRGPMLGAFVGATCLALVPLMGMLAQAFAHGAHEQFAAGEPGDPKKPFRTVKVTMLEDGKKMLFEPAVVEVRFGEQIRFEIFNEGTWNHEFVLATEEANRKHAELMKKFPDMEHMLTPMRCGCRPSHRARSSGDSPSAERSNMPASSRAIGKPACMAR